MPSGNFSSPTSSAWKLKRIFLFCISRYLCNNYYKDMLTQKGFTIIELVVVIAIIAVLAGIIIANTSGVLENAKVSAAGSVQREMSKAVELYYADMGFYPPDVNRGWDPGLTSSPNCFDNDSCGLPWSPDAPGSGNYSDSGVSSSNNAGWLPSNWMDVIITNWKGPYLAQWPQNTPWGGKYDYNYWSLDTVRANGCPSIAGIYMGVEGNYANSAGDIPASAEVKMAEHGFDTNCPNGEAQMLLHAT
jgi:prepilin-type N-terminal cleavage/methylation domain-containing protein